MSTVNVISSIDTRYLGKLERHNQGWHISHFQPVLRIPHTAPFLLPCSFPYQALPRLVKPCTISTLISRQCLLADPIVMLTYCRSQSEAGSYSLQFSLISHEEH